MSRILASTDVIYIYLGGAMTSDGAIYAAGIYEAA
jgi:hypothetical protein